MLARLQDTHPIATLGPVAAPGDLLAAQAAVRRVRVADDLRRYAAALGARTRAHPQVALGAGPRASLALQGVAQALAALDGRPFVLPDDVKAAAPGVLAHRLTLRVEARLAGVRPEEVVEGVLRQEPVPAEPVGHSP